MRSSYIALCVIVLGAAVGRADPSDLRKSESAALRSQLQSPEPGERQAAAMELAARQMADQEVMDELIAGLGRRTIRAYLPGPDPARLCLEALAKIGSPAVPALITVIEDDQHAGRDLALEALGKIGPAAAAALPAIRKCLSTDDVVWQCLAIEAKWQIDGDAASALQLLTPLLSLSRGRQCNAAVRVLVHMGAAARPALPALIAALNEFQDGNVLWALGELAPHDRDVALPALREALQRPVLADNVAEILQNLGEPADELIRFQLARLQKCRPGDGNQPRRIIYTIVIHGPAATNCLGDLVLLLQHKNPEVRQAAAWGLPRIFADGRLVTAVLTVALLDPDTAAEARKSLDMLAESGI